MADIPNIYDIYIYIIIYIHTLDIDNEQVMIKIHDVTVHRCICIYMHLLPNLIHRYIDIHWVKDSFTYTSFITKVRFFAANPCYLHFISVYIYIYIQVSSIPSWELRYPLQEQF